MARPERRISLLQCPAKSPPGVQVAMFHVERDPIQVAPPLFWGPRHQVMNIGINNLQW